MFLPQIIVVVFVNYIPKAEYECAAVWKRTAGRRYTTLSMTSPRDEDLNTLRTGIFSFILIKNH
jgi:hypothetical protein